METWTCSCAFYVSFCEQLCWVILPCGDGHEGCGCSLQSCQPSLQKTSWMKELIPEGLVCFEMNVSLLERSILSLQVD